MYKSSVCVIIALFVLVSIANAKVPRIIGYQGRVMVDDSPYDRTGFFKYSLVTSSGEIL